jgi:hypothetical protein
MKENVMSETIQRRIENATTPVDTRQSNTPLQQFGEGRFNTNGRYDGWNGDDVDGIGDFDVRNLKVLSKKKYRNAILKGRLINPRKGKLRKWYKADKKRVKSYTKFILRANGLTKDNLKKKEYKRVKAYRKILNQRLLGAFYVTKQNRKELSALKRKIAKKMNSKKNS